MVESVNNINTNTQNVQQKKDNAARNATLAGSVGLIGGGTTGYLTKQIYKDDKFTDQFIKQFRNDCIDMTNSDKDTKKAIKSMLKMEDNPSIDAIKKYMRKYKNLFTDNAKDMEDFLKNADNKIAELFTSTKNSITGALQKGEEQLPKYYDKAKKHFNIPLDNSECDDALLAALKSEQKIKGKAGLIYGLASGVILAAGSYILTKLLENKEAPKENK